MGEELDALLGGALHDPGELVLAQHAEVEVAPHVDVAETEAGVEPGVGALAVEVVVERRAGLGEHVTVTGAVDDDRCGQREAALLALEDHAPTRLPVVMAATTQLCISVCTFDSRTMSLVTSLSTSGSRVGDQCTVSRSAAVRTRQ